MLIKKEDVGLSRKLLKEYKEQLNCLSSDQLEISIGLCLGDASLQKQSKTQEGPNSQYRMKFEWGDKNKEYAFHIYETFSEWNYRTGARSSCARPSPISKKQIRTWRFQTISHQAFYPLAELFISPENGKKRIIPGIVQKHCSPQGLAYWYMDDGGLASRDRFATNLNTQGFQFHEVEILKSWPKNLN